MQAITGKSVSFIFLPHNHLIHFCIFPAFHPFPITPSSLHSPSFSLNPFLNPSLIFLSIFFFFLFHTYPTYISIFATLLSLFISHILLALTLFSNSLIFSASLSTHCFFFVFFFTINIHLPPKYFSIFIHFQSPHPSCTHHLFSLFNYPRKP